MNEPKHWSPRPAEADVCYAMGMTMFLFGCLLAQHDHLTGGAQMVLGFFLALVGWLR